MRLTVHDLLVARGPTLLAGPLDLTLGRGEALAVTGANGAGKSTLLRVLLALLPAAGGGVSVEGMTAADGEPARRLSEAAHYLGHRNAMKPTETVGDNLLFWQRFLGRPDRSVAEALDDIGLGAAAALPFGYLSAGQQRRAALARLLVAARPVWILDEPTAALDDASQAIFGRLAGTHLAAGGIVVAATHQPLRFATRALRLERASAPEAPSPALGDVWL